MQKIITYSLSALAIAMAAAPALAQDKNQDKNQELLQQARTVAMEIPPKLLAVLQTEIAKGGPEGAIGVCRDKAPAMAKAASEKSGWNISRVSLKNRNANAAPDAWEKAVLEDFDQRKAAGESPATLEKGEIVTQGEVQTYRYMKALPTQSLCISCHGSPEQFSPSLKTKLHELYPEDKAIGYSVGEIRGAITLKRAL